MKTAGRVLLVAAFLAASMFGGYLAAWFGPGSAQAAPAAAGFGPSMKLTMFDVPNLSTGANPVTTTAIKIADIGTFVVESDASLVEVTHQGRLYVATFSGASGVYFELRVDDALGMVVTGSQRSGLGLVRSNEVAQYVPQTFTGFWSALPAGEHTVSIWARGANGNASGALLDPGGWQSTIVIVKEILPYGLIHLPAISR